MKEIYPVGALAREVQSDPSAINSFIRPRDTADPGLWRKRLRFIIAGALCFELDDRQVIERMNPTSGPIGSFNDLQSSLEDSYIDSFDPMFEEIYETATWGPVFRRAEVDAFSSALTPIAAKNSVRHLLENIDEIFSLASGITKKIYASNPKQSAEQIGQQVRNGRSVHRNTSKLGSPASECLRKDIEAGDIHNNLEIRPIQILGREEIPRTAARVRLVLPIAERRVKIDRSIAGSSVPTGVRTMREIEQSTPEETLGCAARHSPIIDKLWDRVIDDMLQFGQFDAQNSSADLIRSTESLG